MRSKIVLNKWFQRVPKWTPKVDQNRQKGCSGGVPKRDLKKVPSPGSGKMRLCNYLLHFSKVRCLRKGIFLGIILESILETKSWKQGSRTILNGWNMRFWKFQIFGKCPVPFFQKPTKICLKKSPVLSGSKFPLFAIHKSISHIWEDRSRKVNNDKPDLRFGKNVRVPFFKNPQKKTCVWKIQFCPDPNSHF